MSATPAGSVVSSIPYLSGRAQWIPDAELMAEGGQLSNILAEKGLSPAAKVEQIKAFGAQQGLPLDVDSVAASDEYRLLWSLSSLSSLVWLASLQPLGPACTHGECIGDTGTCLHD
eukprot:COSAG05_NODE_1702_length_4249_cov_136.320607_4_plen_116_part_00